MGLLSLIPGVSGNPLYGLLDQNRGKVTGAFGGMVGAGNDPRQALMGFTQGLQHGVNVDTENAIIRQKQEADAAKLVQEQEQQAQITSWLQQNAPKYATLPPAQGLEMAQSDMGGGDDPASVSEYKFYANQELQAGRPPKPYDEWRAGSNQTVRAGLGQPIVLRNKTTGETSAFMPMSDGTYLNPMTQQNADANWEYDPAYLAAIRAQGGEFGKQVASAQFDAPAAQLSMNQTLSAINDIRAEKAGMDEQFGNILGVPQQMTPAWPGSPKAKFQVAVQRGTDRAFLEAREVLRGGGQITDFESKKAENAITNMQLAMEKGDKAQFLQALTDFEEAVKAGYNKLLSQAGGLPPLAPGPRVGTAPPPAGGVVDYRTYFGGQ